MTSPTFYKLLRSTLIAVAFVFMPMYAFADYYVATTGSDSNSGTQSAPFATISKAGSVATAGMTVHVAPGTYNIGTVGFTTGANGTASAHIKYVSDTKWGAKIVGSGTEITWTNSGNYIEVNGFDMRTSGRLAFYSTGSYGSIYNCYVHDIMLSGGLTGNGGAAIDVLGSDWVIHDNVIRNIDVADVHASSHTVQGIYIASANDLVYNNLVSGVEGFGIHQWHGATHSTIVNNTVFNSNSGMIIGAGDSGLLPNGSQNNYIANNIIVNNVDYGIREYSEPAGMTSYNTYRNNLTYNNPGGNVINATGDIVSGAVTANPLFVNYQANGSGDYHVQSTSPAINAGISTNAPTTDLDGKVRPQGAAFDIGAYEYGTGATTPPPPPPAPSPTPTPTPTPTPIPAGVTVLQNGVVLTALSGATGATHMYSLTVPAGATNLRFVSSGGAGDLDLYAKFGSQPTTAIFDAKSDGATTAETISIATPQAGTYYLLTNGWAAYSGVSLVGAYTAAVTSAPAVSLSPTSLNFGSVAVGSASTVQIVTITNTGIAALSFPVAFTLTGDYSFGGTGNCAVGTSYAPGASCTASMQFTPTVSGTRTGTLTITSNAASSPNVVQLTGSGVTSTITPPPPPPGGTTYTAAHHLYVATTGSDSNAGTQTSPFLTISKASSVALADTIVHVAPGTYNIGTAGFTTGASGTATGHIRYLSDTKWGAKIVGSGTEIVWTNSGNYIEVIGFDIRTSGRLGFYSTGSYGSIYNCYVHDIMMSGGATGNGGAGIDFTGSDWIIHDNIIRNIDVAAVSGRSQTHGIYIASANDLVYNNLVSGVAAYGIQQWHGATHSTIVNNTVVNTYGAMMIGAGDSGVLPSGSQNNYVANNILANNIGYGIREYGLTSQNTYHNNLLFNNPINSDVPGTGDVYDGTVLTNPLFVNYQANGSGDYHVQSTSPAINAGISTNAPATDLDGKARPQGGAFDIGAYEYGGTITTGDTTAPSTPAGLGATAVSSSQINLTWTASTDNVGVTGYKIYRAGTQIATVTGTTYSNTGLTASTAYTYTVAAYDAAGNTSAQSASVSATTQAAVTSTAITTLTNGVVLTNLSGATGATHMYSLTVPAGATNLRFVSSGGTGDLDLYVKFGSQPTTAVYDAKSDGATTAETISIATPQAGTYYLLTNGWAAYSGVSLVGAYTAAVTSAPAVSLSLTSLNFGTVTVGNGSTPQALTITNTGTANLSFTTGFAFTGDFNGSGNCSTATALVPGASCVLNVTFTPTVSGTRTGNVTIITNAASSPNVVQLSGTGGTVISGPMVSLSPSPVNFGSVAVGSVSPTIYVTLTNTGNATLDTSPLWSVSAGDFSFSTGGTCGNSLAPGANCTISLKFAPTVSGTRTGSLSVVTNAASSPNVVQLTGTGVTTTTYTAAHHLYVATTGSDSNAGTQAAPFLTISKASSVALPDTIIHVAPGTYNIGTAGFTTGASGTASGHIRYLSDTKWGAKIVGSGTEIVWTNSGNYIEVIGFDIRTSGRLGFYSTGSYGTIYNCYVHDIMMSGGATGNGGAGIDFTGSDWIIHDNIVRNIDVARISGQSQTHGIYIASANDLVYNNLVSGIASVGIQQWHGATHSTIVNNTVFNASAGILIGAGDSGALPNGSQYNYVANNILVNNLGYGIREYSEPAGMTSLNTYRNNLVYNNPTNTDITGSGDVISGTVTANPLFVNYQTNGTGDYHVQSTSPAINAGISTNAPTTDLDGVARPQGGAFDIGAYEYTGGTTPPPPPPAPTPTPTPLPPPPPPTSVTCNYFIAPTGSDSNAGTMASPWKTINYASAQLTAGKTLCARGGTYYGQAGYIWHSSGTAAAPITFRNYPGEKPVFDGQWGDTGVEGDFLVFTNNSHIVVDGITAQRFADQYGNGTIDLHNGQGPVDDVTIQNCTFIDNGSHTAQDHHIYIATGVTNTTVRNNLFIRAAGSAVQTYHSPAASGNRIYNNVMIGGTLNCSQSTSNPCSSSAKQHWGMIIGDAYDTQIYNNTIYGMQNGIEFNYGTTNTGPYTVKNNLIVNSSSAGISVSSPYSQHFSSDYNGFYGNSSDINWNGSNMTVAQFVSATGNESHAITANPSFVNAAGSDFHLNTGSPMIDKGTPMTLFNTDKDGVTRPQGAGFDIGAYER